MKIQFVAGVLACACVAAELPEPKFRTVTIDDKIQIGYGVTTADVDGDGKADKKEVVASDYGVRVDPKRPHLANPERAPAAILERLCGKQMLFPN